ncbi:dihydroorotate dehydrogenase family protein [Chlorobium limicola DSM 245]|uniref:Dihydroorotate dehydrogenase family protein n=1 Tax=Chlorobium limicola (strain DSM 245 / NBRC 103803 / 6330) TaxID=290315 RepID=B3EF39_CHLL2|nr:dihydroorotate dehydrogenase family protein [Chlorobium limicola DSM 245]
MNSDASPQIVKPAAAVSLGRGLDLRSPVMLASGTVSYGEELSRLCDLRKIGGIVTKAISLEPRTGNPPQRIAETPSGMINAIGLANVGVERFIAEKVPFLRGLGTAVIVNIAGRSIDDYCEVVSRLDTVEGLHAYEINLSCPNVKGECMIMGVSRDATFEIVSELRKLTRRHLMIKLTPNVTSISSIALAAQEAGADSVSLINTLVGMAVNYKTRKPLIKNRHRRPLRTGNKTRSTCKSLGSLQRRKYSGSRHGRHRQLRRRHGIPARRCKRNTDRHHELRLPRHQPANRPSHRNPLLRTKRPGIPGLCGKPDCLNAVG